MKAFFAIALLCAASLADAMSTITRIDSSLNEIAPSVGRVLQGGSLLNDAPLDTAVRSNDIGVPMGGGLVGDLLLARFGAPHMRTHTYTQVSGDGRVTRTTHTTSIGGGAGVPGSAAGAAGATLRRTETTYQSPLGPHRTGSFLLTWGGPLGAPSSGSSTATAFQGNWPQSGGFHYTFHGGYPAGGFGYFQNIFHPFIGHGYAGHQNGGYGSGSGYVSGYGPGYGPGYVPGYVPGYASGYGLGSSNYYAYPGFGGYAH
uniref:Glycine rich superfamily member n=1 Tax=Rhipicephalus zambeziensis TaxID=60191 RepID=A0A224YEM9_9ACAR